MEEKKIHYNKNEANQPNLWQCARANPSALRILEAKIFAIGASSVQRGRSSKTKQVVDGETASWSAVGELLSHMASEDIFNLL